MRGSFHVVLDACVMANYTVCDLLLRLAEPPRMHMPHWSTQILDETCKALASFKKKPWPPELVTSFRKSIEAAFPEALVTGHEKLEAVCTNHEKDRHVLATAIRSHSQTIITFNLKDFPPECTSPWNIEAVHPADYLIAVYGIDSGVVVSKLNDMAMKRKMTPEELLAKMSLCIEPFTTHVANALGWNLPT